MYIELVESTVDHSQGHLERVLYPVVLLIVLAQRNDLSVLFFLCHHLSNNNSNL